MYKRGPMAPTNMPFFLMRWPSIKEIACSASLTAWSYLSMSLSSLEMLSCEMGAFARFTQDFFQASKLLFQTHSHYTWLASQHFLFYYFLYIFSFYYLLFHSTLVINFHFSVLYFSAINHSILKKSHLGAIFLSSLFIDFKQFSNLKVTFLFNYFLFLFLFFLNKDFS